MTPFESPELGALERDIHFGYLDEKFDGPRQHHPRLVLNSADTSVLRILREEIRRCRSFTFSVAFVSASAVAMLKTDLLEFSGKGCIITSDYLAFNSPQAFAELLGLQDRGFDVRLHKSSAFHPKGYIFQHEDTVSAMVGSANLTESALVRNHEWNLHVSTARTGDLAVQLRDLVREQILQSTPITQEWLETYSETYTAPTQRRSPLHVDSTPTDRQPGNGTNEVINARPVAPVEPLTPTQDSPSDTSKPDGEVLTPRPQRVEQPLLLPNAMQREALREVEGMRLEGRERGLVISATGTGKTILSALCVRAAKPRRMLFVVHREQILDRTIVEYRRVLGGEARDYGVLSGTSRQTSAKYLFATVQTLSQPHVLEQFSDDAFDYIIIDEAHRAAAVSHRRIMEHFRPGFLLGMTATPERLDGYNVFELFDFNVAYEIRLNHALEAEMLSPFHYYGVTDVVFDDDTTISGESEIARLTSKPRIDHIIEALETYGQAGVAPRGLIFVSRKEEAKLLSNALNHRIVRGKTLRTLSLTGEDSVMRREESVRELESGLLDYIITVDVFNEGVDIPSINQVVMLRQTQSPTIFVQQLGRGLRKAAGKEYLVVIDIIGNYANNYMIPIALFGDGSLNKESLRRNLIAAEERGVVAGVSSVQFDHIAHERVLRAVTDVKLDSMRMLKTALEDMHNRLGRLPDLWDFVRFESADPIILATTKDNFPTLLTRALKAQFSMTPTQLRFLTLLSNEVLTAKRPHEALLVRHLIQHGEATLEGIRQALESAGHTTGPRTALSAVDTLTLDEHAESDLNRYKQGAATRVGEDVELDPDFLAGYRDVPEFRHAVDDLLKVATHIVPERYNLNRTFTAGRQYGRKETARLLGWPRKWTSTIYGYRVDRPTRSCPIFVTLHKSNEVSASTAYEDAIVDHRTMVWFTRSRRTLASAEVASIVNNEVALHVFVKKDDAEGTDFFYLGQAEAAEAEETTMANADEPPLPVVRMLLKFKQPIPASLYDYFHPVVIDS